MTYRWTARRRWARRREHLDAWLMDGGANDEGFDWRYCSECDCRTEHELGSCIECDTQNERG